MLRRTDWPVVRLEITALCFSFSSTAGAGTTGAASCNGIYCVLEGYLASFYFKVEFLIKLEKFQDRPGLRITFVGLS